mgnify:CR=1 FL=1
MKTKEELYAYAIKMFERGDTYRSIFNYLHNNCEDEKTIEEIVAEIRGLEKEQKISKEKESKGWFDINVIGSVLVICFGAILIHFLWGKGYVSTLPFFVIGLGAYQLSRSLR